MADLKKFEEMLERLVNEDKEGAEALFHEIVVEKSRDIYESLLEDEEDDLEETTDEEVEESDDEDLDEADDEELDENFDLDEFEVEGDDDADPMMGGDAEDDMAMDVDMDAMDDDEDEGEIEDRVVDLEDALDELKAEFEAMMSGDDAGEDDMDMDDMDMDTDDEADDAEEESYEFESTDEDDDEDEVEEAADEDKSETETMREYVEKVTAKMGDNGVNNKSAVAGKNDMGGTASNLNQSKDEKGVEANKGNLQGAAVQGQNAKEDSLGNVNVPGGKASKSMKAQPKGHGAEKKGAGEGSTDSKPVIGK